MIERDRAEAAVIENGSDELARKTFYVTLAGCVLFALSVFMFVL